MDDNYYGYFYNDVSYKADPGPTFGVAVSGFALALLTSVFLLLCFKHAGDGPLYPCFHRLVAENAAIGKGPGGLMQGWHQGEHGAAERGGVPLYNSAPATASAGPMSTAEEQQQQRPPPYVAVPGA